MTNYRVEIRNVMGLNELDVTFNFTRSDIIIITGKNGSGKTTLIKAFGLISDIQIFKKTSSLNSLGADSSLKFTLADNQKLSFHFNSKLKTLDTKEQLPSENIVRSELPIPFGNRFKHLSDVANHDAEIRTNIASSNYKQADQIQAFLKDIYPESQQFEKLKQTRVGKNIFYFVLREDDYYFREDHFSSGEFFLIQLYRLITSGSKLVVIDELDISLDASAQVHLLQAITPLLKEYNSKLIMVSHSLALMETAHEGDLYYLERDNNNVSLEQRSFGYVKSDLYGFRGRDRYILTEDETLAGFIEYLIQNYLSTSFFKYEIIPVGGQPQIDAMAKKNDDHEIFGPSGTVIIVVDKDIVNQLKYRGPTPVYASPADDIEHYIWLNRDKLLPHVQIMEFTPAKKDKDTAKTYWKKVINSRQKTREELYEIVINNNNVEGLISALDNHLSLPKR